MGLEVLGPFGLLRSLAVDPAHRGTGLGRRLCEHITAHARLQGIDTLYLLTTTAEGFFRKHGFHVADRAGVPEAVLATEEFRHLCPSTAVCMVRHLDRDALYYPCAVLRLHEDVPGARMWGVALDKSMFTYFEVEPHSRFERHAHESEQITMVLEGTLYFETDDQVIAVCAGEVIALPSNVPHAVFSKDDPVKAVDAWSPVMPRYQS